MVDFNIENEENIVSEPDEVVVTETLVSDTPLIGLLKRREQIVRELFTDIKVPRWNAPEIYIRFKPVSAMKLNSTIARRSKEKGTDWSYLANADMLVDSCVGIYAVVDGNEENKLSLRLDAPNSAWTKFDPDLAAALGVEVVRAVDVCQALFLTEGDLIETANKLFRWSNIANDEADETF